MLPQEVGDGHAALAVLQNLDDLRLGGLRLPHDRSLPEQSTWGCSVIGEAYDWTIPPHFGRQPGR